MIKTKRVYEAPAESDGCRIFVDRLWPRGLTKQKAKIDLWLKDVAPSNELRKWFNHEPEKWVEFKKRYYKELATSQDARLINEKARHHTVTLLYSAKNEDCNNAIALQEYFALIKS